MVIATNCTQYSLSYKYIYASCRIKYRWVVVFLTVHHNIELFQITNLNAQFLYSIKIYMLHHNPRHVSSSTVLIFGRSSCIITASGIVTLCKRLRANCSPLSTGILYGRLQRVTIPEAVIIQFDLPKMSTVLLETCRGLWCNIYIVIE